MKTGKNFFATLMAASVIVFTTGCANEGDNKDSIEIADSLNKDQRKTADSAGVYRPDEATSDFLVCASNSGMAEVMMGELARERATRSDVKQIAGSMVQQHDAVNAKVKQLAGERNVMLPDSVSADSRKAFLDLSEKKGKDFDEKYINIMIDDHKSVVNLFQEAIDKSHDEKIREFAQNTLPQLKQHLDSFQAIRKNIK